MHTIIHLLSLLFWLLLSGNLFPLFRNVSTVDGAPISANFTLPNKDGDINAHNLTTTATTTGTAMGNRPPSFEHSNDLSLNGDTNHQLTIDKQNQILQLGQSFSLGLTNGLIRPFVFVNNQISQAASALPGLMAANGAVLGSAIATPIQMGTLAANNLMAGVTGTLVSIPVSIVSGGAAQAIGVLETGRVLYANQVVPIGQSIADSIRPTTEQISPTAWVRPLAIVGGANSVIGGIVLGTLANGAKRIGSGIEYIGSTLANAGNGIASIGDGLSGSWIPLSSNNSDDGAIELAESTTTAATITTTAMNQLSDEEDEKVMTMTTMATAIDSTITPESASTVSPPLFLFPSFEQFELAESKIENLETSDFETTDPTILTTITPSTDSLAV